MTREPGTTSHEPCIQDLLAALYDAWFKATCRAVADHDDAAYDAARHLALWGIDEADRAASPGRHPIGEPRSRGQRADHLGSAILVLAATLFGDDPAGLRGDVTAALHGDRRVLITRG